MHIKNQPRSNSYLLRIWEEQGAAPPWRFTLVHLGRDKQLGFGSFAALIAFLEKEVNYLAFSDCALPKRDEEYPS